MTGENYVFKPVSGLKTLCCDSLATHKNTFYQKSLQLFGNSQWFHFFFSCHLSSLLVLFSSHPPPSPYPPTHSVTAAEIGDGLSVCLIVCHENRISADGWRDSGGEMQSRGKQHRKGWIVVVLGSLYLNQGEWLGRLTVFVVNLSVCLSTFLFYLSEWIQILFFLINTC